MKKLIAAALATTALAAPAFAEDKITEFRIGILGGENAQDRLTSHECLKQHTEEALGVPVKIFAPADYNGVIQGLLGGRKLRASGVRHSMRSIFFFLKHTLGALLSRPRSFPEKRLALR